MKNMNLETALDKFYEEFEIGYVAKVLYNLSTNN